MKRMLVLLFAVISLLVAAGPASAATAWKGVVVAKDAKRGTVVTASAGGVVRTSCAERSDAQARAAAGCPWHRPRRRHVRGRDRQGNGRAKTARVQAAVVRWQQAQKRLLVSAGGSTFALSRKATRTLSSSSGARTAAGDQIAATVTFDHRHPVGDIGVDARPPRRARGRGILTKIDAGSIELVVAKTGFVTLALPAGFVLPAGLAQFDAVRAHVAVGGPREAHAALAPERHGNNRDDDQVGDDEDEDEVEVTGKITALSDTSITVTPRSSAPVTCALSKPLTGFEVGDLVEIECASGTAGALMLEEIKHEDNDDNDDEDDDDDHSGHGKGGGEDH